MLSSMLDETLAGVLVLVHRETGARDDDRDDVLGAREDERDDEVLAVPNVLVRLLEDRGGRSRIEGGEMERLPPWRNGEGDGRRFCPVVGRERVLALVRGYLPPAMSSSTKDCGES